MSAPHQVTQLLGAWKDGDRGALDKLMPLVYDELHRMARRYMNGQAQGHTLQTTALVNEAFVRLVGEPGKDWGNREHFFGVAAKAMRHVLVDYARAANAAKRGAGVSAIALDEALVPSAERMGDVIALDDALHTLATLSPRQSEVVEMRFFGGMSVEETALALGVSAETVMRDWRAARAWLTRELSAPV
jgi:RNA polymerase sigma factor (TIGR02999 family)